MLRISSLIGRRDMLISMACYQSLVRNCKESFAFVLHDDGSLREEDTEQLLSNLPVESIIPRTEADEVMAFALLKYPECRGFRKQNVLGLKLLDVMVLARSDLLYFDSDIFCFKKFYGLSEVCESKNIVFMKDIDHAYSLRPWNVKPVGGIRLCGHINTGFIAFPESRYDLDFLEWILKRYPQMKRTPVWQEQTCWAALAADSCWLLNPDQFSMVSPGWKPTNMTVAAHFATPVRGSLKDFLSLNAGEDSDAVSLSFYRASGCSTIDLLRSQLNRKFRRTFSRVASAQVIARRSESEW